VSYILLDGKEFSISSIEKLRPQIIAKHERGVSFKDLALQYSMDNNKKRGGDSGWFTYGDMLPEFEQQVMNDEHQKDDIFTVNVESNQWYYVVKKTHDKKSITEIKVLKVVESTR
jgi:parvulin-like peptidyl-prolyl isomerase